MVPSIKGERGSRLSRSRTNVIEREAAESAKALCSAEPTTFVTWSSSTSRSTWSPNLALSSRILRADCSRRARVSRPLSIASRTATIASLTSAGERITSAPASTALTTASPAPYISVIARIVRASVNSRPSKPSSSRSRPVMNSGERVAGGAPIPSTWGTSTCAVMMASTRSSIARTKGTSSS